MPKKKAPAKAKKPQGERFKEFAKQIGATDPKALERVFSQAVPAKKKG